MQSMSRNNDLAIAPDRVRPIAGGGGDSYERDLTAMYRNQLKDFDTYTKPLIDQIEDDSTSTKIVDRARIDAGTIGQRANEVAGRRQNYSMGQMLPSQKRAAAAARKRGTAKAETAIITQGQQRQVADRQAARVQLMQISEQLQSTGTASMSQAVSQKRQRDAAYDQAKSGFMSQIGSIAGGAIGFMAGGPAGAALGSGIGGGVGGAIGG